MIAAMATARSEEQQPRVLLNFVRLIHSKAVHRPSRESPYFLPTNPSPPLLERRKPLYSLGSSAFNCFSVSLIEASVAAVKLTKNSFMSPSSTQTSSRWVRSPAQIRNHGSGASIRAARVFCKCSTINRSLLFPSSRPTFGNRVPNSTKPGGTTNPTHLSPLM